MARPGRQRLRTLEETGIIPCAIDQANLGDRIAVIGPWQGETTDEVIAFLRAGRDKARRGLPGS